MTKLAHLCDAALRLPVGKMAEYWWAKSDGPVSTTSASTSIKTLALAMKTAHEKNRIAMCAIGNTIASAAESGQP